MVPGVFAGVEAEVGEEGGAQASSSSQTSF